MNTYTRPEVEDVLGKVMLASLPTTPMWLDANTIQSVVETAVARCPDSWREGVVHGYCLSELGGDPCCRFFTGDLVLALTVTLDRIALDTQEGVSLFVGGTLVVRWFAYCGFVKLPTDV